jgi:hypothetical protein
MFCIRSRKTLLHPEKIRGCKCFQEQIKNITRRFLNTRCSKKWLWWYNLRKSGAANFSRTVFLNLFWIKYRPWKHQVMIICWKNKDFKQQLSSEQILKSYHVTHPNHILIKSANHTFSPIAWIWGHVVNTCLLHFQVCGWSSGRKTHFETFSR